MCGLCGVIDAEHHWDGGVSDAPEPASYLRRQQHLRLAACATALLQPERIRVEAFSGSTFIVRSATGAAEIVTGLPEVWRAAERLCGRRIDLFASSCLPDPCA